MPVQRQLTPFHHHHHNPYQHLAVQAEKDNQEWVFETKTINDLPQIKKPLV